ncbi:protein cornichon homolog 4-like [Andrographis paniculata]|uniref:protein cornichon homolog 4-like n=1 Tax=Andrographis paniculata TaxID=175694 RepID=UPI0021E7D3B2|nr:protein cornichon homolog 4-like [Andrographis paniculata]
MVGDAWTWLVFFFFLIFLVAMLVFQLVCLTDLELDYINPYELGNKINGVIVPEFITYGVLCFLFLATRHLVMFLLGVPLLYYNFILYRKRHHLIDITEIYNKLTKEKTRRFIKLGYIMFILFMCLFWMIYNILEEHD